MDGVPSVEVFLRDLSPYLRMFRRKPRKLRTARSTSATWYWTWHFPSTSFWEKNRSAISGIKDREFDIHVLPGIWSRDLWCSSWLNKQLHRLARRKRIVIILQWCYNFRILLFYTYYILILKMYLKIKIKDDKKDTFINHKTIT